MNTFGAVGQLHNVIMRPDLLIEKADVELASCVHDLGEHDIAADHAGVHLGVKLAVPAIVLFRHLQHVHNCLGPVL